MTSSAGNPPPEFIDVADRTDRVMASFPKPIIAALNGITVGGGLELAMMADLIVATESPINDALTVSNVIGNLFGVFSRAASF